MKLLKMILLGAALASSASEAMADTRIPAQFLGEWCTNIDEKSNLYEPCKAGYVPESSFMVQPTRLFIAGEVACKVIRGEPRTNGYYVTAQCRHLTTGDKWVYRSLLSRQGARLFVDDSSHAQDVPKTCDGYLRYNVHNARENADKEIVAGVEIDLCDLNDLPDKTIKEIIGICGKPGMIDTKQITNPKSKCKITAWFTQDERNRTYHLTTVVQVCARGRCYKLPRER